VSGQATTFTDGQYNTGFTVGELRSNGHGYTVTALARFTGKKSGTFAALVGGKDTDGTEFFLGKHAGNSCWGHQDGAYFGDLSCDSGFFDRQYHSVVFTSAADGTVKLYIDGKLKATRKITPGGAPVDKETILIGNEMEGPGHPWVGNIAEVLFYSREVSECEVPEIHDRLIPFPFVTPDSDQFPIASMPASMGEAMVVGSAQAQGTLLGLSADFSFKWPPSTAGIWQVGTVTCGIVFLTALACGGSRRCKREKDGSQSTERESLTSAATDLVE